MVALALELTMISILFVMITIQFVVAIKSFSGVFCKIGLSEVLVWYFFYMCFDGLDTVGEHIRMLCFMCPSVTYSSLCEKFQIHLLDKMWSRDFGPSEQMIYFFFSFLISPQGRFFITALSDPFPFPFKNVEHRFRSEFVHYGQLLGHEYWHFLHLPHQLIIII